MKKNAGGKFRVDQKVKNNCLEHRSREGVFLCFANDSIKSQEDVKVCDNCITNIKGIQINETRIAINPKIQSLLDSQTFRLLDKENQVYDKLFSQIHKFSTCYDSASQSFMNLLSQTSLSQVSGIQAIIRQDNLNEFALLISQLVCLQNIEIFEDEENPIDIQSFSQICQLLSSVNNIQNIQLPIFQNPDIKPKQFILMAEKHRKETPLQRLHFNLRSNSILKGESLIELSKVLQNSHHNQIDDFKLDLENNKLIGIGLSEIASQLQKCSSLKNLYLNFHNNIGFSDQSLYDLASALEEKDKVNQLYINLHKNDNFTDGAFGKLADSISYFLSTEKLNLDFHRNSQVTDKGFYSLTSGMSRMKQLKEVTLNFSENQLITDESIVNLSRILVTKTELTTLSLQFTNCDQLTSQSLSDLGIAVGSIQNLKHLHLDLAKSKHFSEDSLVGLLNGIKKQSVLKSLYINLRSNEQYQSHKEMVSCFKSLKSLRKFTLYLRNGYYGDLHDFLARFPDIPEESQEQEVNE